MTKKAQNNNNTQVVSYINPHVTVAENMVTKIT